MTATTVVAKKIATKKTPPLKTVSKNTAAELKPAPAKPTVKKQKPALKPKLVRDSFTIPKDEYLVLAELKTRMTNLKQPAKKSELLRAGLKLLSSQSDTAIKKALLAIPPIKTGRPAKTKA